MPRRIALLLHFSPQSDSTGGFVYIVAPETQEATAVRHISLLLTIEHEPDVIFPRGYLRMLDTNVRYPIQTNLALFEALSRWIKSPDNKAQN